MPKIGEFIADQKREIRYYGRRRWLRWRVRLIRDWLAWCVYFRTVCYWDVAFLEAPRYSDALFQRGATENIARVARLHGVDGWQDDGGPGALRPWVPHDGKLHVGHSSLPRGPGATNSLGVSR